jgi:RIMS-binding protein 2
MSPNTDSCQEELPFKEGQLIKIYGEQDADGFFYGEANGKFGYIPCNMVSEVQVDDPEVVKHLLNENSTQQQNNVANQKRINFKY